VEPETLFLRRVAQAQGRYYDRRMDALPDGNGAHVSRLTAREEEVLRRTSLGQTNAQMAEALGITVHAVKFHLGSIFRKFGVKNRTEAAAIYLQYTSSLAR
jgi:DNA-binding CsgD family transcriptional regulator